jgi:hypothetical protein
VFDHSNLLINSNTFDRCTSALASTYDKLSFQAYSQAGAVSVLIGPSTLSAQNASRDLLVQSPLHLTDSLVHITANTFSRCSTWLSMQSCLSIFSSAKGGAVSFEMSPNVVALNTTLDLLIDDSSFDECFARLSCSSLDKASVAVSGGALSFSSSFSFSQSPIVISRSNFSNFSVVGEYFVSSRNFSVSGGAIFSNTSMPLYIRACNFNSTNRSAVVIRSIVVSEGAGGGLAIHSSNSLFVNIQSCRFQFDAATLAGIGAVVVVDKDVPERRSISRSVQIFDSEFVSAGSLMLLLSASQVLNSNTLDLSNSVFASSAMLTSSLISTANPTSVLSSNSSVTCPPNSHVSVANASDLLNIACASCPILSFSYSSNNLMLDVIQQLQRSLVSLSALSQCYSSSRDGVTSCPFGVVSCTGTLAVTPGLWLFFKNTSADDGSDMSFFPSAAARCPIGFCGCSNMQRGSCEVTAPLDLYRNAAFSLDTSLCDNNRTGVLCSRCLPGFTATINEQGCMTNQDCREKLAWIWAVLLFSYMMYGLYITFSCLNYSSGIMSALLFFAQISQFAIPRLSTSASSSSLASSLSNIAHFDPIVSSYNNLCLGENVSTFRLVLMKLWVPVFVLVFALFWAWVLKVYQRTVVSVTLDRTISYVGTLAHCLLLVFSSLASAVFKLIQCADVDGVGRVVFLDGERACYDGTWTALLCAVIALVLMPFGFAFLLVYSKKIPLAARYALCHAYTDKFYFWAAVTLSSRMFMSLAAAFSENPAVSHIVLLVISVIMTLLLIQCKPYREQATYRIDLMCHLCLILQFSMSILVDASDSVGVPLSSSGTVIQRNNRRRRPFRHQSFCRALSEHRAVGPRFWQRVPGVAACRRSPVFAFSTA